MRRLGIAVLALGLLHVPLPRADYHEIRHQHGRGEVCVHHDHLLRWHPEAGNADAVAMLHWHWFVPSVADSTPDSDKEDAQSSRTKPVFHAHSDGLEPESIGDLVVQADVRGRPVPQAAPLVPSLKSVLAPAFWLPPPPLVLLISPTDLMLRAGASTPLVGLFQQSNC
jgi:hypothetical protein